MTLPTVIGNTTLRHCHIHTYHEAAQLDLPSRHLAISALTYLQVSLPSWLGRGQWRCDKGKGGSLPAHPHQVRAGCSLHTASHTRMCAQSPAPTRAHVFRHNGSKARRPGSPLCTANKGTVITGRGSRADKRIQNFNICCHKGIRRSETQSISLVSAGREPISKSFRGTEGTRKKKGGGREKERNYRVP